MKTLALAAVMACLAFSAPALSAAKCGDPTKIHNHLKKKYKEDPVAVGIENSGRLLMVYSSPSGTFTIVMTSPGGPACLMAAGKGWETLVPQLGEAS